MSTRLREEIVEEKVNGQPLMPPVEHIQQEIVTQDSSREVREKVVEDLGAKRRANLSKVEQFIWLATGLLVGAIALRFMLKLIAANPVNPFAVVVYGFTDLFLWPFQGLTITPAANGMILEISSLIAIVVYVVAAAVLVKLLRLVFTPTSTRSVSIYQREEL